MDRESKDMGEKIFLLGNLLLFTIAYSSITFSDNIMIAYGIIVSLAVVNIGVIFYRDGIDDI